MLTVHLDDSELKRAADAFARAPEKFLVALKAANIRSATALLTSVKSVLNNLLLHVRTGKLRGGFSQSQPTALAGGGWSSFVGSGKTPYARYQDQGFVGIEQVKAHTRRTKGTKKRAVNNARREIAMAFHAGTLSTGDSGVGYVYAHERKVNYPGTQYVHAALSVAVPKFRDIHVEEISKVKVIE